MSLKSLWESNTRMVVMDPVDRFFAAVSSSCAIAVGSIMASSAILSLIRSSYGRLDKTGTIILAGTGLTFLIAGVRTAYVAALTSEDTLAHLRRIFRRNRTG